MALDLQALKDEIDTDAAGMSYILNDDVANAEILNNSGGAKPRSVNRDTITTASFVAEITFAAYDAMAVAAKDYVDLITRGDTIAVATETLANLAGIGGTSQWAVGDQATMEPRVVALMQYQGSRAEELKDTLGVSSVSPADLRNARRLP